MSQIKRKQKLIDRRFQLNTIFSAMGISLVSISILLAAMALTLEGNNRNLAEKTSQVNRLIINEDSEIRLFLENARKASANADSFSRAARTEKNLAGAMLKYAELAATEGSKVRLNTQLMTRDHGKSLKSMGGYLSRLDTFMNSLDQAVKKLESSHDQFRQAMTENLNLLGQFIDKNRLLLYLMIVLAVAQSMAIYYFFLQKTFRAAGPVYVLTRYVDEIKSGKRPDIRKLREKDEFKTLHAKFGEMVAAIDANSEYFRQKKSL
jgi:hypothetical protein